MQTRKQKTREKKHDWLISRFHTLSEEFQEKAANGEKVSRMAMWEVLENESGFSRQYITSVLRHKGIDYLTKQKENGN